MEVPRVKRQKVTVACDICRSRKIKCDGRHPCEPCRKRTASGVSCTWSSGFERMPEQFATESTQRASLQPRSQAAMSLPPSERNPSSATYQAHKVQVSGAHRPSASDLDLPTVSPPNIPRSSASRPAQEPRATNSVNGDGSNGAHRQTQEFTQRPDEVSPSEHSVHAIIGATLDEDTREGFFGNSSAGTFMQNVRKLVQQRVGGVSGRPASSPHINPETLSASGQAYVQPKSLDYVLPSRRRADTLMSCYWSYVHVLYPYLDRLQVEEDYEKLWRAEGSIADERSYICLVNVIFALSSQIDDSIPIENRQASAHIFYVRARALLDIVETGNVRSVQCLLLLGQYYQSTSEPHPCWIFTGLAIRTAQSLGLHLAETSERVADTRGRELLRKVWHGCILMDRVVSMTYGRPCMIGPRAGWSVPLPIPVDEEYLDAENQQTQQTFAVEFYVLSLKLFEIMHDIIYNSVNVQPGQPFGPLDQGPNSILEIDRRLSKWATSVPDRFQVTFGANVQPGTVGATVHRQAVVLHQRQLHVRLLLLRPVLSYFISSGLTDGDRPVPFDSILSQKVYLQCAIVCVKVALEAIDTIRREKATVAREIECCAAWWYNVLYLYTSATVLIAARLAPAVLADISEQSILDGWRTALELLEGYSATGASIKRLTTTLSLLFEAVPQHYSRFKGNCRQPQGDAQFDPQNQAQGTVPLPYWRPSDPVDSLNTPDLNRGFQDENDASATASLLDFDIAFDPNDLSWLMTIPLDT